MKRRNATRNALFTSIISLLLCVSMLVGTTFAWFTDTVESGVNVINAGNLDVELYHGKTTNPTSKVDASTKLFTDTKSAEIELWEPGVVAYTNLKVANDGNLALKYQMALSFTNENTVNGKSLADVLKVALIPGGIQGTTREAVLAEAKAGSVGSLQDFKKSGKLEKNEDSDVFGLVVYWPDDNSNEFDNQFNLNNGKFADDGSKTLKIDLGITLFATQLQYEEDSFGSDYDENIWEDAMFVASEEDLVSAIAAGETAIVLEDDIALTSAVEIPEDATVNLNLNGKTITGNGGRDADGNRVHVIVNNGNAVIKNGVITSAGVNGGSAIYNANGATLTVENVTLNGAPQEGSTWPSYTVNNYGTLTVSDSSIYGVQGIIATNNTANTTVNNVIAYRDGWSSGHVFYNSSTAKVTINGGTYTNDGNGVDGTMIYGGETVVNGGTFIVKEGAYFALCSGSKLTVNGGDFSNIKSCLAWGGAMTISGGTFGFNPTTYVADGYHALQAGDKYQVVPESVDAIVSNDTELAAALQDATTDEIILAAGEFTADIYNITARDTLIITGQGADTKLAFSNLQVRPSQFKNLTISNCTIERMPNKNWGHLVYGSSNNANGVYTISNCIFNGVGSQGIYINETVSGATYNIENCVFNGDFGREGAITIQNNADVNVNVNVNGCTFNNIPETSNEIFVHYENKGLNLTVDGKVTVANVTMLADAVSKGATEIYLLDGNYVMPDGWTGAHDTYNQAGYDDGYAGVDLKNKTLTIIGSRNAVIDAKGIDSRDQFVTGATLAFEGVTVNFGTNIYMGFMNTASLTYKDCAVNGLQLFSGAGLVAFEDCDLNSNGAEHCVWTWGGQNVSFTGCDFTYGDRAVNCYGEGVTTNASFTNCTFTKVAGKETTGAIETNSSTLTALNLTINNCSVNEGELWFVAGWDSLSGAKTTVTVDGTASKGVVLVQSGVLPYLTLNSNATYMLTGDFGGQNVSLVMPVGVENVIFDGSKATNINELIIVQNGKIIDNANDPIGERSGNVTVQNFNVLSQINVFACKTEVVVQKNTAEALMIHAGNCAVKVLNNTIDANFESHPTYRDANNTWNTNNYGIALNIFDYNLWLDGNTVTDATGHAIGINGWEGTIDNGDENVIESFKDNKITVNSTTNTKRAAFKVWDDETYASNDDDTNVVNATAQAFIDAVLADGSNIFNIVDGYDHTIFSFYHVNTNN